MSENETTFGEAVRQMREAKSIGLRQFAARVGMSATYLSKVERGELLPPSEQKIRSIAKQLGQNEDVFLALAGRLSPDIQQIIRKQPRHLAAFLRTADGLPPEKITRLTDQAARMKQRRSNSALPPRKTK